MACAIAIPIIEKRVIRAYGVTLTCEIRKDKGTEVGELVARVRANLETSRGRVADTARLVSRGACRWTTSVRTTPFSYTYGILVRPGKVFTRSL